MEVLVIGGGLAGTEAALTLASLGYNVLLTEMRPVSMTPAHRTSKLAELVCSNSLGSLSTDNAKGELLHELEVLGSRLVRLAKRCRIPGDKALVVDRELFADLVEAEIDNEPRIKVVRREETSVPTASFAIFAPGPLASDALLNFVLQAENLSEAHFYDATSPTLVADTIDFDYAFWGNRFGEGEDYLNIPMTKEQYFWFVDELIAARNAPRHDFDKVESFFERCLPVEEIARRGKDSLAYGPMRPTGLNIPSKFKDVYAVIQLRKENAEGTLLNMVGFQTGVSHSDQLRIFRQLPALRHAEFARLGQLHRNTFVPGLVNRSLQSKTNPRWFYAGQFVGTEGYLEAIAGGLWAAMNLDRMINGLPPASLPEETIMGGLFRYIEEVLPVVKQPIGANWGLVPVPTVRKSDRKQERKRRAQEAVSSALRGLGKPSKGI
ncbi:methylenetetrahydrofolate--tRNA-(uracil(54)-C(5))-methyltransferase (FADH(2)-oxidizing) TrmFO [Coprothermobacteraceae bacterium]|nr:methylenetetrahydrofolate--tRNA-(uracil(54)-C(5))-methyltransferase (FADH(2)-oxidizing) TrmFO [Coprothermobacteraceae bacterium]